MVDAQPVMPANEIPAKALPPGHCGGQHVEVSGKGQALMPQGEGTGTLPFPMCLFIWLVPTYSL